jgi:hypothetical protein
LAVNILGQELHGVNGLLRGAAGRQAVYGGAGAIRRSVLDVL